MRKKVIVCAFFLLHLSQFSLVHFSSFNSRAHSKQICGPNVNLQQALLSVWVWGGWISPFSLFAEVKGTVKHQFVN